MPRKAVLTEEEKKERKNRLYTKRKKSDKAEHDAQLQKEYLMTIQQVKLSLPNKKAEQLTAACQELGMKKPQELINKLIDKYLAGEITL